MYGENSNFNSIEKYRPFVYWRDSGQSADEVYEQVRLSAVAGVGGFIPIPVNDKSMESEEKCESLKRFYEKLLPASAEFGLAVAFTLDECIEQTVVRAEDNLWEDDIRSRKLVRHIHYCAQDENVKWQVFPGKLLSVIAYNEERDEVIDLRDHIENENVVYKLPRGNWRIVQYVSLPDHDSDRPNILSREASESYLEAAYSMFADLFDCYIGSTITHVYYANLAFKAVNRHDWCDSFNEVFETRYGFDPSPYYPYLFTTDGNNAPRYKALFSDCRARMLRDGYIAAVEDFAKKKGLSLIGTLSESKSTQCSPIMGDALLNNTATPGAVLDRGYLYGINSVKVAAGAAFGRAKRDIFVELYRGYKDKSYEIMMRDAAHAFARGANLPALHLPKPSESNQELASRLLRFTGAMRTCLENGRQVSDIAVVYPIYYLHSRVNMYSADISGFEYSDTPADADYMSVINSICLCAGHDVTLLHPDVIARSAHAESDRLRLVGMSDEGGFRIIVLPAQRVASLACMRVLRDYFDAGGRIIATGELPTKAFEFDPSDADKNDKEMVAISEHIFGKDALDSSVMKTYCKNTSESGGTALFLYFSKTGIDGVSMVSSLDLRRALASFKIGFDVFAPQMPKYETTGALNASFNEYTRLGLLKHLPDGGMFNHIHKRAGEKDIYYFANTTNRVCRTPVFLRGTHVPTCYNPETGGKWHEKYEYVSVFGKAYTRFEISMRPTTSLVIVSEGGGERKLAIDPSSLRDCTEEALGNKL
ncbi:MAG: hypothetical protein IJD70_05880 [Clostridia bacterium]|nr:hypothetical protein [Clostridia bacterium]